MVFPSQAVIEPLLNHKATNDAKD